MCSGHFDPSAQYCTENCSPGATVIGMLTWTLKPSGVVTSTRVPGVALGSDTSVSGDGLRQSFSIHSFPIYSHAFPSVPMKRKHQEKHLKVNSSHINQPCPAHMNIPNVMGMDGKYPLVI